VRGARCSADLGGLTVGPALFFVFPTLYSLLISFPEETQALELSRATIKQSYYPNTLLAQSHGYLLFRFCSCLGWYVWLSISLPRASNPFFTRDNPKQGPVVGKLYDSFDPRYVILTGFTFSV
jgi:hypothetical protein